MALIGALVLSLAAFGTAGAADGEAGWGQARVPSPGAAQSIGEYASGCIAGAAALQPDGPGYQIVRLGRNRFYGHPSLIDYLGRFGLRVAEAGLGVAQIGDLAQPRGGPMSFGHASHQTGLDADIWLRLDVPRLPAGAREGLEPVTMVDGARFTPTALWGDTQTALVRLAAEDPRVARIFLNPVLKRDLCRRSWPDRSWLRLVRPWPGHDEHFHVRLHCPPDSAGCVAQAPPPDGDGCGAELAAWFPDPNRPPKPPAPPAAPTAPKPLPAACAALLD